MNVTLDWNEWFFIIASFMALAVFLLIWKYFSPVMILTIWVYNIFLVSTIDYFLIATPFKVYYTGWKLYYSIPVYPLASVSLILVYRFTKRKLYDLSLPHFSK